MQVFVWVGGCSGSYADDQDVGVCVFLVWVRTCVGGWLF
jgi:hypothetical protein